MILDTALKSLQIVLGEAKSTKDCDIVSNWSNYAPVSGFTLSNNALHSNGTTAVTVVPAPAVGDLQANAKEIRLYNNDSITHNVTLELNNNGTLYVIESASVAAGAVFLYTPDTTPSSFSQEWNAGTVDFLSSNLTIRSGATLDLNDSIAVTQTAAAGFIHGGATAALPTLPSGTDIVATSTPAVASRVTALGYGAIGIFTGQRADGTPGAPTAVQTDDNIVGLSGYGYGATAFSAASRASIFMAAAQNWTDAAQGTRMTFQTTKVGGTVTATVMALENNGDISLIGQTSGQITEHMQAAAGTWEWDWPTTAGTAGQVLTSQGGGGTAMTWTSVTTGTVTEVDTSGAGISGGPITGKGTLTVEWNAGTVTTIGSGVTVSAGTLSAAGSGGTVTQVNTTGSGITGGPITTVGTLAVQWNAGTVTALNPAQLALSSGTLQFITGPTIQATGSSAPAIVSDGITAYPSILANTDFWVAGTAGTRLMIDAFAGNAQLSMRRTNGTQAAPTAVAAGNVIATLQGYGYDGTAYSASQGSWQVNAINSWTTADHSTYHAWFATNSGSTTNNERMRLTGGALLIGTTAAVGSELLNVNGGFVMGGTLGSGQGGTVAVGVSASPVIINRLSAAPALLNAQSPLILSGGTTAGALATQLEILSYGGASQTLLVRANGTPSALTALNANNVIAVMNADGYNGTAFSGFTGNPAFRIHALNNWTTADASSYMTWLNIHSGTTVQSEDMRLTGGALLIGTTTNNGTDTLQVNGSSTQTQVARTTTNAAAGYVGEFVSQTINIGSAVALTNSVVTTVGSIVLTAGDWDINGEVILTGNTATTVSQFQASINTTAGAINSTIGLYTKTSLNGITLGSFNVDPTLGILGTRVTNAGTYFLNTDVTFGVSTLSAYGLIQARRR